jgi:hypothetical protein
MTPRGVGMTLWALFVMLKFIQHPYRLYHFGNMDPGIRFSTRLRMTLQGARDNKQEKRNDKQGDLLDLELDGQTKTAPKGGFSISNLFKD